MAIGTNNKFLTIDVELNLRNKKIYIGFQINVQQALICGDKHGHDYICYFFIGSDYNGSSNYGLNLK
jgi:hypothetical protein